MQFAEDADGFEGRAYVAEIRLQPLYDALNGIRTVYQPLPRHPAAVRDLSLLADIDTPAAGIEEAIRKGAGKTLESVRLFDLYQGPQVPEGKKSISYSRVLPAPLRMASSIPAAGVSISASSARSRTDAGWRGSGG